jgi:hypothetical protein
LFTQIDWEVDTSIALLLAGLIDELSILIHPLTDKIANTPTTFFESQTSLQTATPHDHFEKSKILLTTKF